MSQSSGWANLWFFRHGRKKIFLRRGITSLVSVVLITLTPVALAGIPNSAHDFRNSGRSNTGVCQTCHTPLVVDAKIRPMWNHETETKTYELYGSPTMDSKPGQPEGQSKLCLSCHDGTVAFDKYTDSGNLRANNSGKSGGINLSASHPISMAYNTTLARVDGNLWDPRSKDSGLGGTIDAVLLHNEKVECTSCHNIHDKTGNPKLLVKNNSGSALCLTCHRM